MVFKELNYYNQDFFYLFHYCIYRCSLLKKWKVQSRALHLDFDNLPHGHWPSTAWQMVSPSMMQKQAVTWLAHDAAASSQFVQLWGLKVFKSVQNNSFYTYTVTTQHKWFMWPVCTVIDLGRDRRSIHYVVLLAISYVVTHMVCYWRIKPVLHD